MFLFQVFILYRPFYAILVASKTNQQKQKSLFAATSEVNTFNVTSLISPVFFCYNLHFAECFPFIGLFTSV